jgi:hypothetical protein
LSGLPGSQGSGGAVSLNEVRVAFKPKSVAAMLA